MDGHSRPNWACVGPKTFGAFCCTPCRTASIASATWASSPMAPAATTSLSVIGCSVPVSRVPSASLHTHPRRSPAHRSRRVKPFSEPSADRSEKLASLIPLPLVAPEVCSKLVLNLRHHGQEGSQESARQAVRQGRGPEARARPSRSVIVHTPRRRGVAAHAPTRSDPLRANSADPSRASSAVETRSLDPSANATDSCR